MRASGMEPASPVRRLLAFGVDYLLIAGYLVLLAAASLILLDTPLRARYIRLWSNAASAETAGFLLLTLPVLLYFALSESSSWQASLGKRVLGLQVIGNQCQRLDLSHSLLRSGVKFLPWELAHFTIWHFVYLRPGSTRPPEWTQAALGSVYVLVAAYLLTLFMGSSHRTVYDRVADARVMVKPPARGQ
jgi:uncharacterized RDD family membrane protein YckC